MLDSVSEFTQKNLSEADTNVSNIVQPAPNATAAAKQATEEQEASQANSEKEQTSQNVQKNIINAQKFFANLQKALTVGLQPPKQQVSGNTNLGATGGQTASGNAGATGGPTASGGQTATGNALPNQQQVKSQDQLMKDLAVSLGVDEGKLKAALLNAGMYGNVNR